MEEDEGHDEEMLATWDGDWSRPSFCKAGGLPILPQHQNPFARFLEHLIGAAQDEWSSTVVVVRSLAFKLDSLLVACFAAASPCFFFYYRLPNGEIMAFNQSWTLISIVLIFPMTMTLSSAFTRRESALVQMSLLRSNLMCIYLAHRDWDWWTVPKDPNESSVSGRDARLPPGHVDSVRTEIKAVISTLRSFLHAPMVSRGKHLYTAAGRCERSTVTALLRILSDRLSKHLHRLSVLVEEMKAAGLPANEATRIRQHFVNAISALMQLRFLKQYRTPLGLRSFSRVFILLTPVMFGPYFASLALSTGIAFAICFSVAMAMALQGLFNIRYEMEDPFLQPSAAGGRDAVDVERELGELERDLDLFSVPLKCKRQPHEGQQQAQGPVLGQQAQQQAQPVEPVAGLLGVCVSTMPYSACFMQQRPKVGPLTHARFCLH